MPALPVEKESQRQNRITKAGTTTSRKTENHSTREEATGERGWVTSRRAPQSQALLHKIKSQQRNIKAKATAVSNVT
jgi:hypothetical protein